ncbi:DUF1430 domain-containing protein [Sutcliffiella horikoshii]|uniref:DUF1430 domain-containing protein n=1 Tax=Sutcliffiella horikoshii TaxID=79883 RepID=UPI001F20634E|nr:DUF1430 domain-containing protein [Sutcliffiella horikoshii]MCG1023202.1 DUF1430 domain-containing protein [Sutcliffiella horikoshii]
MKKIKYLMAFLFLSIASIFVGEFYIYYLDNFEEDFYHTEFYKPFDSSNEEMTEALLEAAEENEIILFTLERNVISTIKSEMTIYGEESAKKELERRGIQFRNNQSLLLGNMNVSYRDFSTFEHKERGHDYYLAGDEENVVLFKQQLVDQFGGGFPRMGAASNAEGIVFVFFSVCLLLILFLSYYEIQLLKKEFSVRVLMGADITRMIGRQVAADVMVFTFLYIISFMLTSELHHSLFHWNVQMAGLCLFLVFNSLLYAILWKGNFRKTLSSSGGKSVLAINYGLKVVMSVLCILSITAMATFIDQGVNYYKQKDIISTFEDYSYVQLNYRDVSKFEESAAIREKFHQTFEKESADMTNLQGSVVGQTDFNYPVIRMNEGALKQLPEALTEKLEKDYVHFLIPRDLKDKNIPIDGIKGVYSLYEPSHPPFKITYYEGDLEVLSVKDMFYPFKTRMESNPIMLVNSAAAGEDVNNEYAQIRTYIAYDVMYDITDEEYQKFLADNEWKDELEVKTNVKDLYEYNWKIIQRGMYISFILLGLVLAMNLFIVATILRVEYTFNAKELLLMKILGRSLFERNRKIILLSIGASVISAIIAIVISFFINTPFTGYLIMGSVLILLLDCLILYVNITRLDKKSLVKVLKGGIV